MELDMTMMLHYILEAPDALNENIRRSSKLTRTLVDEFVKKPYRSLWIIASGSSYNAAMSARPLLLNILNVDVRVLTPHHFCHYEHSLTDLDFAFVISQSGCSTNSIEALRFLRSKNRFAIGVTGCPESDFKAEADLLVDYGLGIETIGYVTKGVITLIGFLALFAFESATILGRLNQEEKEVWFNRLENACQVNRSVMKNSIVFWDKHVKTFTAMPHAFIMGAGSNYGTALEAALKMSETIQIPCLAIECEEFLHGYTLQLTPNYPLFFIDPVDSTSKRILDTFTSVLKITDRAFLISNNPDIAGPNVLSYEGHVHPLLSPIAFLPFFQYLSFKTTDSMHRWMKHPLYKTFSEDVPSKTESYVHTVQ